LIIVITESRSVSTTEAKAEPEIVTQEMHWGRFLLKGDILKEFSGKENFPESTKSR
jgi:hypothetical protein